MKKPMKKPVKIVLLIACLAIVSVVAYHVGNTNGYGTAKAEADKYYLDSIAQLEEQVRVITERHNHFLEGADVRVDVDYDNWRKIHTYTVKFIEPMCGYGAYPPREHKIPD